MKVIFRNKVHTAVSEILQTKDWLLEFKKGNPILIKTFSSLKKSTHYKSWWKWMLIKKLTNEKNDIYEIFNKEIKIAFESSLLNAKNKKRGIIEGDLIASLTFGFWTSIVGKPYLNILGDKGLYIKVFKEIKLEYKDIGTTQYNQTINKIRDN